MLNFKKEHTLWPKTLSTQHRSISERRQIILAFALDNFGDDKDCTGFLNIIPMEIFGMEENSKQRLVFADLNCHQCFHFICVHSA